MRRARDRKVLEVPAARSGGPYSRELGRGFLHDAADMAAQGHGRGRTGRVFAQPVPGQPAGAQRHRDSDVGQFVLSLRHFEGPAANIQVQQCAGAPAEPAAGRQIGHGGFLPAAEFPERHTGFQLHKVQHALAVGGLADRRGAEGEHVLRAVADGEVTGLRHEVRQQALALRR